MEHKTVPAWHERELSRFTDGTYKPIPISLNYPADHYVHLSVSDTERDFIAYTPSDRHGEEDRQVRLKFGRYLRKTFEAMTDSEIQAHVTALKSALSIAENLPTLHFATDTDTLNRIFETEMCACGSGYTSCMHGKFTGDIRPYHVYANSPDVAVAYVLVSGDIVARSVVSTKDKTWVRLYAAKTGDNDTQCGTLKALLAEAGYTEGELFGNRLTKLNTHRVMLPYIDNGGAHVREDGRYWVVVDGDGDYEAECTDGTATPVDRCDGCNRHRDDCECIYCECCEESYADGCDNCHMCEHCEQCHTHSACDCSRCSECHELIEHYRGCTSCDCDRCSHCNELDDDCDCEKCENCGDLTEDCECETEEEEYPEEVRTTREILESVWTYLRNQQKLLDNDRSREDALFSAITIMVRIRDLVLQSETEAREEVTV